MANGITINTEKNLIYGTNGWVSVDGVDLGATVDDFQVEWAAEQYYPDLAQALGPVSGTGRVVKGEFKMMCKITEWTYSVLSGVIGTYGTSETGASEQFGGQKLGLIVEVDNVVLTGLTRNDGKKVAVVIPRAYVEIGNPSFSKSKETSVEITFHGVYTAAAPDKMPGAIYIEK